MLNHFDELLTTFQKREYENIYKPENFDRSVVEVLLKKIDESMRVALLLSI